MTEIENVVLWEGFWMGAIFGVCATLVFLIVGIALYVRLRGGFTITAPKRSSQS